MNPLQPEIHPLTPFLPPNARLLLLGSFPPPRKRWSMDFFYPNYTNDMWRIFGLIFFDDKDHFVDIEKKKFRKDNIEQFLREKAIAVSDTVAVANRMISRASKTKCFANRARSTRCTPFLSTATRSEIGRASCREKSVG